MLHFPLKHFIPITNAFILKKLKINSYFIFIDPATKYQLKMEKILVIETIKKQLSSFNFITLTIATFYSLINIISHY